MIDPAKFWDKAAVKYSKSKIGNMDAYMETINLTRGYLSKTDKVLEIGCGTGSTALLLAGNVMQITASDISPKMIEIAQGKAEAENISNATFLAGDVFDSRLNSQPYDAVLAHNILHLLQDLPASLARIHEMLGPDGLFISKTFCLEGMRLPFKYRMMKRLLPLMQMVGKAPYVSFMSGDQLEKIITAAGFKIIETGDYPTRYIVARKA